MCRRRWRCIGKRGWMCSTGVSPVHRKHGRDARATEEDLAAMACHIGRRGDVAGGAGDGGESGDLCSALSDLLDWRVPLVGVAIDVGGADGAVWRSSGGAWGLGDFILW